MFDTLDLQEFTTAYLADLIENIRHRSITVAGCESDIPRLKALLSQNGTSTMTLSWVRDMRTYNHLLSWIDGHQCYAQRQTMARCSVMTLRDAQPQTVAITYLEGGRERYVFPVGEFLAMFVPVRE